MTRIALLSPCIIKADAVSNDVLGMYHTLTGLGHEVRLFAGTWTVPEPDVTHFSELEDYIRSSTDVLIYHHSIGWDDGLKALKSFRCRKIVKYHNVTPPEFFEDISDDYMNVCRVGRAHLQTIARMNCDLYLFDSDYNRTELLAEGVAEDRSAVVYPFHRTDRLQALEAELAVLDVYRDGKTNLLAVGRLAPNKSHPLLVRAFAVYHHDYNRNSRLLIVGKQDELLRTYTGYVRGLAAGLGLEEAVVFSGEVSDRDLKAYYLTADVFLALSAHEGFCIPLVEAMALKVPIVARGSSAIPSTVGEAGLVWDEGDPDLVAESVDYLVRDGSAGAALGRLGWRRYQRLFANEQIAARFLHVVEGLL
jgi:glycosyltransferase involved in cell wall biosynthesis